MALGVQAASNGFLHAFVKYGLKGPRQAKFFSFGWFLLESFAEAQNATSVVSERVAKPLSRQAYSQSVWRGL